MEQHRTIWMPLALLAIMAFSITLGEGEVTSAPDVKTSQGNTANISKVWGALQGTMAQQSRKKITVRVNGEGKAEKKEEKGIAPLHEGHIFYVNENPRARKVRGRGFNILTIERKTGKTLTSDIFDTHSSDARGNDMWVFVKNAPDDTIVLVSVLDEAASKCNKKCYDAIREVGGTLTKDNFGYRDGYALIGYKGSFCGSQPPWMKEMKRTALPQNERDGQGSLPISLISQIDLDFCYRQ